jgi:hypothetical protein
MAKEHCIDIDAASITALRAVKTLRLTREFAIISTDRENAGKRSDYPIAAVIMSFAAIEACVGDIESIFRRHVQTYKSLRRELRSRKLAKDRRVLLRAHLDSIPGGRSSPLRALAKKLKRIHRVNREGVLLKVLAVSECFPDASGNSLAKGKALIFELKTLSQLRNQFVHDTVKADEPRWFEWLKQRKMTQNPYERCDHPVFMHWVDQATTAAVAQWAYEAARKVLADMYGRLSITDADLIQGYARMMLKNLGSLCPAFEVATARASDGAMNPR